MTTAAIDVDPAALVDLIEKEAIREASLRYTRGIDRHDVELMLAAYHPDATDDHGLFIGSPADFADYANGTHDQNWVSHQHYVTNQLIDRDGDLAHCESYFMAVLKREDGRCDMVGGRYVDRFAKRNGNWAVADRACLVEWHALVGPGEAGFDPSMFLQGAQDKSDISYSRPLKLNRPPRNPKAGTD